MSLQDNSTFDENLTHEVPNSNTEDPETISPLDSDGADPQEFNTALLTEAQARVAQLEQQLGTMRAMRQNELLTQAIHTWAVDPELVLKMSQEHFALDEAGQLLPVDGEGAPLLDNNGKALSVDGFFQQFRQEKPYLVKASAGRGAGSRTQSSAAAANASLSMAQMADLPMAQFVKAGGLQTGKTLY